MMPSAKNSLKNIAIFAIGLTPAYTLAAMYNSFNGFYVGAMGGILTTESKITASATAVYENFFDRRNKLAYSQGGVKIHKYSGIGDIYIGYGQFINNSQFYLAGEVFGDWAGNRKNSLSNWVFHASPDFDEDFESISSNVTMKLRDSEYGLDIRPGIMMDTHTMAYGRIGVAFNRIKNNTANTFTFSTTRNIPPGLWISPSEQNNSKSVRGLRLGLGLERMVTDTLSITADYIYTYYGKVKTSGSANITSIGEDQDSSFLNVNGLDASSSGRMGTQAGMIGIKYYFLPC